ncbi:cupin domain-containing protein [Deinococcus yunweiensis]|uniref:cupin domain-containing protein n=1 Tax=Deinococcus yunweiensis TaxID=367282 RepID=UPI00398EAE0B
MGTAMMHVGEQRFSLGNRIEVRGTAQTTGGQRLTLRVWYAPQRRFPPLHRHPQQTETFTVQAGELTVQWMDGSRTYAAGEGFEVPPDTPHTMRNAGADVAVVDWTVSPALHSGDLFARLYSRRPRPALADVLAFVWYVAVSRRYRPEIRLVRPRR